MLLTEPQAYELLEKYGVFSREACDKCGQLLGAVRYTRKGDSGVWCSRACRGESKRAVILKPGRPRKYKNAAQRRAVKTIQQRNYRSRPRVEKTVCSGQETKDLQPQKTPLSHYRLSSLSY
jgi:hypothetical protein